MTRNLKALGLALVAAMALGAFAAQGASASVDHEFQSDAVNEQTVLTGANESYTSGNSKDKFTGTANLVVECDVTFGGTNVGNVRDTVTVHPKYHNCTSPLGAATVDTDGCNYVFGSDTTTSSHSSSDEHAMVTLECESAHTATPHAIEITTPGCNISFETTHAGSVVVNHSLHGVTYTNLDQPSGADAKHSSKSAITVTATVKTIKYTVTAGSFCGLAGHAAGTYSNGTYDSKATVTGYEDVSSPTGTTTSGTTWHHGDQVNIWVSTTTNTP